MGSEFKVKVSEKAYQWPATLNPCRSFRAFGTRIRDQASNHTFRLTLPQLQLGYRRLELYYGQLRGRTRYLTMQHIRHTVPEKQF